MSVSEGGVRNSNVALCVPTRSTKDILFRTMLGGAIAGAIADGVTHPIDTVRARLVTQSTSTDFKVAGQTGTKYKGLFHGAMTMARSEGVRSFYKGFGVTVGLTIPAHALYFAGYEFGKRNLAPEAPLEDKPMWVHLASGGFAECTGAIIWVPQEVVKQRLQIQVGECATGTHKNGISLIRHIVATEGITGLYRGYGAALATYGPFVGIYFAAYEKFKKWGMGARGKSALTPDFDVALISGALAGSTAAMVTSPIDLVKTRLMVQDTAAPKYSGIIHCLRTVIKEEGAMRLFSGLTARITWMAPSCAITIASYELLKRYLDIEDVE